MNVTKKAATEIVRELHQRELYELAEKIAHIFALTVREMFSLTRDQAPAWARAAFYAALRETGIWSSSRIGELVGRDHSTILTCLAKHAWRRERGMLPRTLVALVHGRHDSSPPPPPPPPEAA